MVPESRREQGLILERSLLENTSLPYLKKFSSWIYGLNKRQEYDEVDDSCITTMVKHSGLEKEVQKYNPDINLIVTEWENEAYKTQIQLALNGNDGPDVFFNWFGEDSARLARSGLALDLTSYADMKGGYGNFISKGCQEAQIGRAHV